MKAHRKRVAKIKPVNSSTVYIYMNNLTGYLNEITLIVLNEIISAHVKNRDVIKENWCSSNWDFAGPLFLADVGVIAEIL